MQDVLPLRELDCLGPSYCLHLFPAVSMVQAGELYCFRDRSQIDSVVELSSFIALYAIRDDNYFQKLSE